MTFPSDHLQDHGPALFSVVDTPYASSSAPSYPPLAVLPVQLESSPRGGGVSPSFVRPLHHPISREKSAMDQTLSVAFDSDSSTTSPAKYRFYEGPAPHSIQNNPLKLRFAPMSVDSNKRYARNDNVPMQRGRIFVSNSRLPSKPDHIPARQYDYPSFPDEPPSGWTVHKHSDGALYYLHTETRTFTDVNICDASIREEVERYRDYLRGELQNLVEQKSPAIDEVELVLEPMQDKDGNLGCYYFVNPRARCLFWLHQVDFRKIFGGRRVNYSLEHQGLAVQAQYWKHWEIFPDLCKIPKALKDEVVGLISQAICDNLTLSGSAIPLGIEDLKNYLSLIQSIPAGETPKGGYPPITMGRLMHIFYLSYFLHSDSGGSVQLHRQQTFYGWRYKPSILMTVCMPILFMAPIRNVRSLHRIFVDDIPNPREWNNFVRNMQSHLQDTNLLATVLLGANVGYLTIQTAGGNDVTMMTHVANYGSLVFSISSMVLGLTFAEYGRTQVNDNTFSVGRVLHHKGQHKHGLETLAIVYSLPYALLLWGMCFFFIAFVLQWCQIGTIPSWVMIGSFLLAIFTLSGWCIWKGRMDGNHYWWWQADPDAVVGLDETYTEDRPVKKRASRGPSIH